MDQRGELRTPVISAEQADSLPFDRINHQWNLLTERIRRDVIASSTTRQALLPFIAEPVSQTYATKAVDTLTQTNQDVQQLYGRYAGELGAYLHLPEVPESEITPDLQHAARVVTLEDLDYRHRHDTRSSEQEKRDFRAYIERNRAQGYYDKGITKSELWLAARRYRFARDVKLLALGAEILENPGELPQNANGEYVLPSGTRIFIDGQDKTRTQDFLVPHNWQKRRQIKDRVFEIEVGGNKYILKERKTNRHTDTKKHGHVDGNDTKEEFMVAKHFYEQASFEQNDIRVSWEQPLGYVVFPDGYQAAIFTYEEGLNSKNLVGAITDQRAYYEDEYQQVAASVQQDPEIQAQNAPNPRLRMLQRFFRSSAQVPVAPVVSFDIYAQTKAKRMYDTARYIHHRTIYEQGYSNSDLDGMAYKIDKSNGVKLTVIGFDFEYFHRNPPEWSTKILGNINNGFQEHTQREIRGHTHESQYDKVSRKVYKALVDLEAPTQP